MGEEVPGVLRFFDAGAAGEVERFFACEARFDTDHRIVPNHAFAGKSHDADRGVAEARADQIVPEDAAAGDAVHAAEDGDDLRFIEVVQEETGVDIVEVAGAELVFEREGIAGEERDRSAGGIVAGLFGFTGIAAGAAGIAKILFFVFVAVFLVLLVLGLLGLKALD